MTGERLIGWSPDFGMLRSVCSRLFVVIVVSLGSLRRASRYRQETMSRISSVFPGFRQAAYFDVDMFRNFAMVCYSEVPESWFAKSGVTSLLIKKVRRAP